MMSVYLLGAAGKFRNIYESHQQTKHEANFVWKAHSDVSMQEIHWYSTHVRAELLYNMTEASFQSQAFGFT